MTQPVYLDIKNSPEAQRVFTNFSRTVLRDEGYDAWEHDLALYNAKHHYQASKTGAIKKHYIRFATEKDLTAFLLKYS